MSGRKSSTGSMKQTTLASFFKKPSTPKAPEEPVQVKGPGAEVVGRRLKVWWPADAAWYAGGVASYDGERHAIQYDDGDEEAVDLSKEKFEFLEGTHAPKDVKRETKRPAPSAGLTAEQRADRERKRRKAADSDDDFVVDDDASISEEEEEDEVFDESDDDDKPKPKKRRVIADDSDEEMPAAKASPSSVPVSTDKKTTRPGTPTPFDASGFHDRYRKRSAPVSADKRESYDLVELTDQKVDSHDSEKKSVLPAGCHTHDVDPKYAFLTTARRDADGRTPDDPLFNARTLKVDWHKEPVKQLTGTQQTWF